MTVHIASELGLNLPSRKGMKVDERSEISATLFALCQGHPHVALPRKIQWRLVQNLCQLRDLTEQQQNVIAEPLAPKLDTTMEQETRSKSTADPQQNELDTSTFLCGGPSLLCNRRCHGL